MTPPKQIVVVLGYSDGRREGLHPICAARLERAAEVANEVSAVVLSGWARRRGGASEAELMRAAWANPSQTVLCDPHARLTVEAAANLTHLASELGADEVVVVTSWWHRPRAALFLHRLLRGRRIRVATVGAPGPWSLRLIARELCCFALVPVQLRRVRSRLDARR
jgi:uncharacterized SAM-binding protein YcdF (DUF218 family)